MTSQRQDFYDSDAIQHEYLDKLGMWYPQDKYCNPYMQEHYRQRQEKPKLEKNGQTTKRIQSCINTFHKQTYNQSNSSINMTITQ